jgi:CDGSH-type Zn-finger protein
MALHSAWQLWRIAVLAIKFLQLSFHLHFVNIPFILILFLSHTGCADGENLRKVLILMAKKIRIIEHGPYEVSGGVPTYAAELVPYEDEQGATESWEKGLRQHGGERPYLLCRCGHSSSKPFCDAHHYNGGFFGKEVADRAAYAKACKVYKGETFDLLDRTKLCAVARFCDVGIGAWKLALSNEPEDVELAKQMACSCPSGRLTVQDKDGKLLENELDPEIFMVEDPVQGHHGPLHVRGGIALESADGSMYEHRNRRTLCRCGESSNIPFCDSSHLHCSHMEMDK